MRILWTVALLMAAFSTQAQNLEDVIYKKDGSVLRGTLVEQDFENGRYKIQLQGGSLFSVNKADIEKITKEAPTSSISNANGININIDNNPVINQNPVVNQNPVANAYALNDRSQREIKSVFYIGSMGKSFMDDEQQFGASYSGLNLAYQANASKHIAIYTALNIGSLSTMTMNGVELDVSDVSDEKYRSVEIDALLSSNNFQGWQFYTGLGLFSENYSTSSQSDSYTGTNFILGIGYSWQALQAQLRMAFNNSPDYNDAYSHVNANLQLGFNF